MNVNKIPIPSHVISPGFTVDFVPVASHVATNRAGLGYAILRALGAHERMTSSALELIAKWANEYGEKHDGVTPQLKKLTSQTFQQRIGPAWGAIDAAKNASCYPGRGKKRPSYSIVYNEIWIEQRWPELCIALASQN